MMNMNMTSMCSVILVYFSIAELVCLFVSDDFRSGHVKNLFTVRTRRMEYVISKTLVGVVSSVLMLYLLVVMVSRQVLRKSDLV